MGEFYPNCVVAATLTRPADTNAYQANDAVQNATTNPTPIEFEGAASVFGGGGLVLTGKMTKSTNNVTAATFRLWIYQGPPSGTPGDNAAFLEAWQNRTVLIGYIDFTTVIAGTDCVTYPGALSMDYLPFKCPDGRRSLYGVLQALGAYAPIASEQFYIQLGIWQDR